MVRAWLVLAKEPELARVMDWLALASFLVLTALLVGDEVRRAYLAYPPRARRTPFSALVAVLAACFLATITFRLLRITSIL